MDAAKKKAAASGLDLIDLSTGASDLPPPIEALQALANTVHDTSTHSYCLKSQTLPFLASCTESYHRLFGVKFDPASEALLLIGSQEGLAHALLASADAGDSILVPDIAYPSYFGAIKVAGLNPIHVQFKKNEHEQYLPDLDAVDDADLLMRQKAKILLLNFPNNPTSAMADEAYFVKAVDFCKRHRLLLIHDNPYVDQTYDADHAVSPLSLPGGRDVTIELFSLSKSFHLAGFRIGWALGNKDAIRALEDAKAPIDFNQWVGAQRMAQQCLELPRERVRRDALVWKRRAECLTKELRDRCQWEFEMPQSCMYIWGRMPSSFEGSDDLAFCLKLLEKTGVAISPGQAFGPGGVGCVRFALVQNEDKLIEAVERIREALIEMKSELT